MLEHELLRFGYVVLFFGTMVEGDVFLLASAFLAHRGYFNIAVVIAVAAVANTLADQVYYWIARARGYAYFERRATADPRVARVRAWVGRRSAALLFTSRFLYGFRIAIPAACGAAGMRPWTFFLINLSGGLFWAAVVGLAGFAFGGTIDVLLADLRRYEWYVALGLGVVTLAFLALRSRDVSRAIMVLRRPAQVAVDFSATLFAVAHRAGRLTLTHPTARLAGFVLVLGLMNIVSASVHWQLLRWGTLADALPFEVRHGSRVFMLLVGLALVALGRGLARRKQVAWYLASATTALSALLYLGHGASVVRAALSAGLLSELLRHRHAFTARSDPLRLRHALMAAPVLALALTGFGVAGFHQAWRDPSALPSALVTTWRAALFQDLPNLTLDRQVSAVVWSLRLLSLLSLGYVFSMSLAPVVLRGGSSTDRETVERLAWEHGEDSLSYFAKQEDKQHLVIDSGAFIGYRLVARVAVVAGDPIGRPDAIPEALDRFLESCAANDWIPVFYEASSRHLDLYRTRDLRWFKIGEEGVLSLPPFGLQGSKIANVRHSITKIEREVPDLRVVEYDRTTPDPELDDQLEQVSDEWLRGKRGGELGFNLGVFSVENLAGTRTFVAQTESGYVWAFVTWLPYRHGRALVLDAMRRRADAPTGVMELLIVRSALQFKQEGVDVVSLATAPLANVDETAGVSKYDQGVRLAFERFSSVYGYRSLFHFKRKFGPTWEGRYLVFPRPDQLPRIAYALVAVHSPGGMLSYLRSSAAR